MQKQNDGDNNSNANANGNGRDDLVVVRPLVWWAAANQWVPLSTAEYLAPAGSVPAVVEPVEAPVEWVGGVYDEVAESRYNREDCGRGRSFSI